MKKQEGSLKGLGTEYKNDCKSLFSTIREHSNNDDNIYNKNQYEKKGKQLQNQTSQDIAVTRINWSSLHAF